MRGKRKDEHLKYALEEMLEENGFDQIRLSHTNLSGLKLEEIDISSSFLGFSSSVPFYINAITGGTASGQQINKKLATIANHFKIPMMVGSQMIAVNDASCIDSFKVVRDVNKGFVVANVSANATVSEAMEAIKMINADAIAIHLNVIQELVMEEGDRDFRMWLDNIIQINSAVSIPVLVKEVGFGLSVEDINLLISKGIKYIDVSGKGGTNFARVENRRLKVTDDCFEQLGLDTATILFVLEPHKLKIDVYSSGGIRNELDVVKSLVLGAKMVGMSNWFLKLAQLDLDEAIKRVDRFILNIKKLMLILGARSVDKLVNVAFDM